MVFKMMDINVLLSGNAWLANGLAMVNAESLGWQCLRYGVTGLYLVMLLLVAVFGLHRWMLVYLFYKHRKNTPQYQACFRQWPRVTIQLPMYNEQYVAERIIKACCAMDYPSDKLQIQVLDDSTDGTAALVAAVVDHFAAQGVDVVYLHRDHRHGFKAGALDEGLKTATGDFIAIFDADFVPQPDILKKTVPYFTDPKVGMVQVRWDHINRNQSLLTESQAILLDAHFIIEHAARNRSGRFMNFNGTAGLWRRDCIEGGGGWQHDTLTEDLDLSYRCQIKGWQFIFLPEVTSPAELPPEIDGFKQQQFRWTKGAVQTAMKLLPKILGSRLPWKIKIEASFHLLNPMSYLFMSVLLLMLLPVFYFRCSFFDQGALTQIVFDMSIFMVASCSASAFYMASQKEIYSPWWKRIPYLPFLMGLGVGIALNNAKGILQALFNRDTPFERTPKFGVENREDKSDWLKRAPAFRRPRSWMPWIELAYGVYMVVCIVLCVRSQTVLTFSLPFLVMFAVGYFYVGSLSLYVAWRSNHDSACVLPQAAA